MIKTVQADNHIIGHIIYDHWAPDILFIHSFRIWPEYRGRGYFKLLLSQAREIAKEQGASTIMLSVGSSEVDETQLKTLYKKYGFREWDGLMRADT